MEDKKRIKIYTDGACKGNPGPGGWGAILMYNGYGKEISGGNPDTTNNRMELIAVIEAFKRLKEPCIIDVYSDSTYVVNAFEKGWLKGWKENGFKRKREPVKNSDLWKELDKLVSQHEVSFHWVKGHANNKYNERCDQLAVAASNMC